MPIQPVLSKEDVSLDNPDTKHVFLFLNTLRESGETNMFGASPWLENAFDLDRTSAKAYLTAWMTACGPGKGWDTSFTYENFPDLPQLEDQDPPYLDDVDPEDVPWSDSPEYDDDEDYSQDEW